MVILFFIVLAIFVLYLIIRYELWELVFDIICAIGSDSGSGGSSGSSGGSGFGGGDSGGGGASSDF